MKNLTDVIEGFFDNVNVSKDVEIRKFIQDLQKFIDKWKSSSQKTFTYDMLNQYASRAHKGNFDFDICIEAPSSLPDKNSTSVICSFWKDQYNEDTPGDCKCWTFDLIARSDVNDYDAMRPNHNSFDIASLINDHIRIYRGEKKSIKFRVRVYHDRKYTEWM